MVRIKPSTYTPSNNLTRPMPQMYTMFLCASREANGDKRPVEFGVPHSWGLAKSLEGLV